MTLIQWIIYGFEQENSEFQPYHDDCGCDASEKCLSATEGRPFSAAHMDAIRARDIAHTPALFRAGSGQNVYELVEDVRTYEPTITVDLFPAQVNFDTPDYAALQAFLTAAIYDRHHACVVNVGNAQALPGNEQRVQWHFVAVGGGDAQGRFLLANGDDVVPNGPSRWVTWAQIEAAHPVAIVEYRLTGGSPMSGIPAGWSDANNVLTAPNGVPVVHGFRDFVLAHQWEPSNVPLAPESGDANHSVQTFLDCELGWTPQYGVYYGGIGKEVVAARQQIAMLTAANQSLQSQHATDQEEIAALKNQPPVTAATPYEVASAAAMDAILAAQTAKGK